jgi:hypothetical protein
VNTKRNEVDSCKKPDVPDDGLNFETMVRDRSHVGVVLKPLVKAKKIGLGGGSFCNYCAEQHLVYFLSIFTSF